MRRELEVQGLDRTLARLSQIDDIKGQREIAKAGLRGGMKPIRAAMKQKAPRGSTGILARDIRYKVRTKSGDPYGIVGVFGQLDRGTVAGHEAPRSDAIARWIEYGTAAHRIPSRSAAIKHGARAVIAGKAYSRIDHPGIAPAPFLRPALDGSMSMAQRGAEEEAHKKFRQLMAKR